MMLVGRWRFDVPSRGLEWKRVACAVDAKVGSVLSGCSEDGSKVFFLSEGKLLVG